MNFKNENKIKTKRKLMSKNDWKRVEEKIYFFENIDSSKLKFFKANQKGVISIIKFTKIKDPLIKKFDNEYITLLNTGYYWLQIAFEDENFWITALFNSNKKLIQVYIDITEKNIILDEGKSYFIDLFLDIVILKDDILIFDESELEIALNQKVISKQNYLLAKNIKEKIVSFLKEENNKKMFIEYLIKEFDKIIKKIER